MENTKHRNSKTKQKLWFYIKLKVKVHREKSEKPLQNLMTTIINHNLDKNNINETTGEKKYTIYCRQLLIIENHPINRNDQ